VLVGEIKVMYIGMSMMAEERYLLKAINVVVRDCEAVALAS